MQRVDLLNKLILILQNSLDYIENIKEDTLLKDINGWDSLEHASIISDIEKAFNIKFQMSEIVSVKSVGALINAIEEKCK